MFRRPRIPAAMNDSQCMKNSSLEILQNTYDSAPLTVISSLLSIFGSSLIIVSYLLWKDVRKSTARAILLFLAIADFLTAVGYLWSSIAYLVMFSNSTAIKLNDSIPINLFDRICTAESFLDTYFPVVSFFWTAHLAIYFFVTLVLLKPEFAKKLMIPFHLTAWFIPLILCIVGVKTKWLGPARNKDGIEDAVTGAWCFVSSRFVINVTQSQYEIYLYYWMEVVFGKGIEISVYFIVIVCYVTIICVNRCRATSWVSKLTNIAILVLLHDHRYLHKRCCLKLLLQFVLGNTLIKFWT